MNSSPRAADLFSLETRPDAPAHAARILELLPGFSCVDGAEAAVELLHQLLPMIGADSAVFLSLIKDDATRTSVRSLLACDPRWALEYTRPGWDGHDPWLRHALHSQAPIRSTELDVLPGEVEFVKKASRLGFASAVIAPAQSHFGTARVGVLILGSSTPHGFDSENYPLVRIVARALAMELHDWLLQALRSSLLERSRLTPDEIELLRCEAAGQTSKMIATGLNTKPKTVDGRFQRLSEKLDAPDRRSAVRIARLYGLI